MSAASFYDLTGPTAWAKQPSRFSFSSLQVLRACPRRWQLLHSAWGEHPRFPERPHPAAIEGQIVHDALDLLARELGRHGRPPIGSVGFRAALDGCGFWAFFVTQVEDWNRRLASHPRAGPRYVLRTMPGDLANQAVALFRERYVAADGTGVEHRVLRPFAGTEDVDGATLLRLLRERGSLSELRLKHPVLPLVGAVDVVEIDANACTAIVDFKTGARKEAHREQVLLYALLWLRVTGTMPDSAVVQYLDSSWVTSPSEGELLAFEAAVDAEIQQARASVSARPAAACPGSECTWCPVRPRCDEGWALSTKGSKARGARATDIEIVVARDPSATGFLGTIPNGQEIAVVFEAAVGRGLAAAKEGDRFRVVDAVPRDDGKEIRLMPWTEMYRIGSDR